MTNSNFESHDAFVQHTIDACYINSLVNLVNACRAVNVPIHKVETYQNGWRVEFLGFTGDAVCHDGSYGNPIHNRYFEKNKHHNDWSEEGKWETIGFPWDYEDVSVHTAGELASFLAILRQGLNPWEDKEC